ncbi:MAG: Crp/Fnr family transcriptional regulator [Burkholderiaceae bacterium]
MTSSDDGVRNHLIEILPGPARQRLLALCEPAELTLAAVLGEAGRPMPAIYFPLEGFVSLLAEVDGHPGLGVGLVGREGMLGEQLALGVLRSPLRAVVQGAGRAWRIAAPAFRRELAASLPLRLCVDRYLYVRMVQLARSAACLRFHLLAPRLARLLLSCQDRAQADRFHMTHESLARMLGVRRVGVTLAANAIQRLGLISYRRGEVCVLLRRELTAIACSCYGVECRHYAELLG